jgi:DNA topoisomerase-1
MRQLIHNGVFIPPYVPHGFKIRYRGQEIALTPEQEEMAVAFCKCPPERLQDSVFVKNFLKDFCSALGLKEAKLEDFDFSEIKRWIEEEKLKKENMTREEKKLLAEIRKKEREERKEKYGYAIIDGKKVEINFMVEPPCIFVGRGKHPLRGRWKPRIHYSDITLNLSPDAPTPPVPDGTKWGGRVWDPDCLWIARWRDKLTGKMKYVWISDTAPLKQEREKQKFELAKIFGRKLPEIKKHIEEGLHSPDPLQRKIATVAYLIDLLKIRVGDEKDPEELDTVGATTLRKSNVKIVGENKVEFDFLGKGAVRFHKTVEVHPQVVKNLQEFMNNNSTDRIFPDIRCEQVNDFLGQIVPGVTAKVFRTYYASEEVKKALEEAQINKGDTEFEKVFAAKIANLRAAQILNHKKTPPKNWRERLEKREEKIKALEEKIQALKQKAKTKRQRERLKKLRKKLREQKLRLKLMKSLKNYNLATSLRSYINPEIYAKWAKKVELDIKKIYTRSLLRKFGWILDSEQPA